MSPPPPLVVVNFFQAGVLFAQKHEILMQICSLFQDNSVPIDKSLVRVQTADLDYYPKDRSSFSLIFHLSAPQHHSPPGLPEQAGQDGPHPVHLSSSELSRLLSAWLLSSTSRTSPPRLPSQWRPRFWGSRGLEQWSSRPAGRLSSRPGLISQG